MAHHGFDEGGQRFALQRLQEGLVEVLRGVAMTRVEAVVAKCLVRKSLDLGWGGRPSNTLNIKAAIIG